MDTMRAFANGEAAKGKEPMVFDWHKAAELINTRKPTTVSAGLSGDWEWTGGLIFEEGAPVKKENTYTYLSSTWARPEIEIDGEILPCYVMQSEADGWNSDTYWPVSALKMLDGATNT